MNPNVFGKGPQTMSLEEADSLRNLESEDSKPIPRQSRCVSTTIYAPWKAGHKLHRSESRVPNGESFGAVIGLKGMATNAALISVTQT
jgi:hypothetical protein